MKKNLLKPGFELIFSAGVVICMVLPSVMMAQNHKELKVTIINGDTTINGKNIKDLSPAEHADAVKNMGRPPRIMADANGEPSPISVRTFTFKRDSLGRGPRSQTYTFNSDDRAQAMVMDFRRREADGQGDERPEMDMTMTRGRSEFRGPRRNTESFSYSNVNKDGIGTNVNYNVSDANRENVKRISGADKSELALNDLVLTPSFSTGKTNISFSLIEKGSAEVQFKDSDGKILWSEKISSGLNKSFELPQNGIYYLQVKQNGKVGLRRIIKES